MSQMTELSKKRMSDGAYREFPPSFIGGIDLMAARREGYFSGYQAGILDPDSVKNHPVVKELEEALKISRDKHIGMAMCLKEHGTNLSIPFLIDDCMRDAERDELALTKWREFVGKENT